MNIFIFIHEVFNDYYIFLNNMNYAALMCINPEITGLDAIPFMVTQNIVENFILTSISDVYLIHNE